MFELTLVDVNHLDREREVAAHLRRRQILKTPDDASVPIQPQTRTMSSPRRFGARIRAAER